MMRTVAFLAVLQLAAPALAAPVLVGRYSGTETSRAKNVRLPLWGKQNSEPVHLVVTRDGSKMQMTRQFTEEGGAAVEQTMHLDIVGERKLGNGDTVVRFRLDRDASRKSMKEFAGRMVPAESGVEMPMTDVRGKGVLVFQADGMLATSLKTTVRRAQLKIPGAQGVAKVGHVVLRRALKSESSGIFVPLANAP
jgi:hypothetical protein